MTTIPETIASDLMGTIIENLKDEATKVLTGNGHRIRGWIPETSRVDTKRESATAYCCGCGLSCTVLVNPKQSWEKKISGPSTTTKCLYSGLGTKTKTKGEL
jgi:hypothetical protein